MGDSISRVDKDNNNTSSGSIAQKSYMISTDLLFIVMCEHFLTNAHALTWRSYLHALDRGHLLGRTLLDLDLSASLHCKVDGGAGGDHVEGYGMVPGHNGQLEGADLVGRVAVGHHAVGTDDDGRHAAGGHEGGHHAVTDEGGGHLLVDELVGCET